MNYSKSNIPPNPKWGPVDLSQPIGTILAPGMYDAVVADAKAIDGDESLRMIVSFEVITPEGEIISPEPFWLTLAAIPKSKAEGQIREGLRNLLKLTRAAQVEDGLMDHGEIIAALVGKKLRVKVTRSGSGINSVNRVVTFDRSA